MISTQQQIAAAEAEQREADAFVDKQWKEADEWIAAEWPHATASERAMARSIWTELARRAMTDVVDPYLVAREAVVDELPGRPRLGYTILAPISKGSTGLFPTIDAALEAHQAEPRPPGWVVMRLSQFMPMMVTRVKRPHDGKVVASTDPMFGVQAIQWNKDAPPIEIGDLIHIEKAPKA